MTTYASTGVRVESPLKKLREHLLLHDVVLPDGWQVRRTERKTGASARQVDTYYVSPQGARLRSRNEVLRLLQPLCSSPLASPKRAKHCSTPPEATSPYFAAPVPTPADAALPAQARLRHCLAGVLRRVPTCTWVPPPSPYGLLQEAVFYDPWRVLVVCVLLNKTTCLQVRTVVSQLFVICPTAEAAALADVESIRRVIAPLGLVKRAEGIISLSAAYLTTSWVRVTELPFVGKYASDAYALFCSGAWRDVEPDDKELVRYHAFLRDTDGLGRGYEREELQ